MMNRIRISSPLPLALLVAAGLTTACGGGKPPAPQKDTVPVRIAEVVVRSMPIEVRVVGHAEPMTSVAIRARVGGEITKVHFRQGDDVAAGAILFTLDSRPLEAALAEATANLERDRARAKNAADDEKRYAELVAKDYVTREQYEAARTNAQALGAAVKADEAAVGNARLQLGYATLRSPIAGRTGSLFVHEGNLVRATEDKPLVVVNQVRPIQVSFAVAEDRLPEIRRESAARRLSVTARPQGPGELPESGSLAFIENSVDRATGTILLKASFPNTSGALWPGQFVDVALALQNQPQAIVVPATALQTGQKGTYVYVVKDDSTVDVRPVELARQVDAFAVIAKGLKAGERVVVDGQLRLSPGAKVEDSSTTAKAPAETKS